MSKDQADNATLRPVIQLSVPTPDRSFNTMYTPLDTEPLQLVYMTHRLPPIPPLHLARIQRQIIRHIA